MEDRPTENSVNHPNHEAFGSLFYLFTLRPIGQGIVFSAAIERHINYYAPHSTVECERP